MLTCNTQQAIIKINQGGNYMVKIDKELLKRLLAIADAHDYLYEYRDVIECLKNDNGFDDVAVHNFLNETDELTDKILEDEQDTIDWLETWKENNEWFSSFSDD